MGAGQTTENQEHCLAWPTEGREEGKTTATAAIAQKLHFHSACQGSI